MRCNSTQEEKKSSSHSDGDEWCARNTGRNWRIYRIVVGWKSEEIIVWWTFFSLLSLIGGSAIACPTNFTSDPLNLTFSLMFRGPAINYLTLFSHLRATLSIRRCDWIIFFRRMNNTHSLMSQKELAEHLEDVECFRTCSHWDFPYLRCGKK